MRRRYYFNTVENKYIKSETIVSTNIIEEKEDQKKIVNQENNINNNICTINIFEDSSERTGGSVYYAATFLCEYLLSIRHEFKHKCVIELGAGTGLCGLLLYHLKAKQVVLTDCDLENMKLLNSSKLLQEEGDDNIKNEKILIEYYNWMVPNEISDTFPTEVDYVIASDVIYDASTAETFLNAIQYLCSNKYKSNPPKIIVSHQPRLSGVDDAFYEKLKDDCNFILNQIEPIHGNPVANLFELIYDPTVKKNRKSGSMSCKIM